MQLQTHQPETGNQECGMSPVYAFLQKPSMVDYPGRYAAVFFTSGCNFSCGFCHNAPLMATRKAGITWARLEAACVRFRKEWVNGAVVTGGEPTCGANLPELLRFLKQQCGFFVKLDTNGSNPAMLRECLPWIDYVAMDLKCGLSAYPGLVGFADTDAIRESIGLIRESAPDYEFRTTVIESVHSDDQMEEIRQLVEGSRRYSLQAFIPRDDLPGERFRRVARTTSARLCALRSRLSGSVGEIILRGA